MKSRILSVLGAMFFPARCAACRVRLSVGVLCADCRQKIVIYRTMFCGECGERLFGGKNLCHPDFPYTLGAATAYADPRIQPLIRMLKFGRTRSAAEPLDLLMREYLDSVGDLFKDCAVMPIPLSPRRLRERGFNQSEILARPIAVHLGFPLDTTSLARIRHTRPQTEMRNATERRENLRGCFAVRNAFAVRGKNIILVDDVTTTGTTLLEAAKVLKNAGATKVYAFVVAKA